MEQNHPYEFELRSSWALDAEVGELLRVFDDPMSLTNWWSTVFMRGEIMSEGDDQNVGMTARFFTKGLLPHTFQFTARIDRIEDADAILIRTWGDFDGHCDIVLSDGAGCALIHIRWQVTPHQPYIRRLIRLFRPIFVANHRWAMRRGREGLQQEVLRRRHQQDTTAGIGFRKPTFPHNLAFVQRRFSWSRESINWATR